MAGWLCDDVSFDTPELSALLAAVNKLSIHWVGSWSAGG